MDPEKTKKVQSLKVIISEAIMVIAVIVTVIILALLVSGYWVNSDFKVERQGLLQVSSIPTGADIYIDGDSSWLQRTNTSKVLPSGEHTVTLKKDGYDSWSRTITISEGLLFRLHYPRLFPIDRTSEVVLGNIDTNYVTYSPDHNTLLMINDTTNWQLVNLDSDKPELTNIDVSQLFADNALPADQTVQSLTSAILDTQWDYDGTHVLIRSLSSAGTTEWILLNIKDYQKSINLTKEFNANFSEIQILDNSSNNLLAVQNGNLHKIDVSGKSLSAVLVKNIINFDHYHNNEIIFSASSPTQSDAVEYYVGFLKLGEEKITDLTNTESPTIVTLSKFYDDKYIAILENSSLSLYKKEDFELVKTFELSFIPETMEVGHNGEFITMSLQNQIATLDMETMSVIEWQTATSNYTWIDNDMISDIANNSLVVYDFDGLNQRTIANDISDFPSAITNNKWLYYFKNHSLVRENIEN